MPSPSSRRSFLQSAGLLPALAVLPHGETHPSTDPVYTPLGETGAGPSGLLFSQVGYPSGYPVRVIVRAPARQALTENADCALLPNADATGRRFRAQLQYWGQRWQSHWWTATFDPAGATGEWTVEVEDQGRVLFREDGLRVADDVLWEEVYDWATVDMLLKRSYFTKVGAGWQDAGALWVESPAQSAMTICLADVNEYTRDYDAAYRDKLYAQQQIGADYLVMLEAKSTELGNPPGSTVHDLHGHEEYALPNDTIKATVALYRTAATLPDKFADKRKKYLEVADRCLDHMLNVAQPIGDQGMGKIQRGLPQNTPMPADEWPTRDLMFMLWACLEKYKTGASGYQAQCMDLAEQIMARQITQAKPENGYYGHFLEYPSAPHSQKSWTHTILSEGEKRFGTDIGALFPNYLMPFFELLEIWPDHKRAAAWKATLRSFSEGFLLPTCKMNPFHLVPLGIFGEEGPIWFTGPFHGTNAIYGYTAALAARLYGLFGEEDLKHVAMGNLQWIAGLNAGITTENIAEGSVIYTTEVPDGIALPASMICRVGRRWAGTWFQTKGVVCNGFSVGPQFKMEIMPTAAVDGPFSFTDEDWIPHSAGYLTGLMAWNRYAAPK